MSLVLTATVTRSQVAEQGSLASHGTAFGPDGRRYEWWAELETSGAVRGVGHVKRYPARGSTAPPETWTIQAFLSHELQPVVQAKISEVAIAFDPFAWAAHEPFVLVSVNAHESRAGVRARAWEFADLYLPGIVRSGVGEPL